MTAIKERQTGAKQCNPLALFKKLKLFANLADEEVARFAEAAHVKSYKKGDFLYQEETKADFFYIICSGWLKLFHNTPEGEEIILAMLTKNDLTGESVIFEQERYKNSAQVVEDAQILSIPIALLQQQLRVNNQLLHNMLSSVFQYQTYHQLQLEQYLLYSAPQRIGCFLLALCPAMEMKDGVLLTLPYDKTLIASVLGMKGPTFSRALNILRDETGIHISGTRVTIGSMDRLLKFVNGCYSHHNIRKG